MTKEVLCNTDEVSEDFKEKAKEAFKTLDDNTSTTIKDENGGDMVFTKMHLKAEAIDHIAKHFNMSNIFQVHISAIAILETLAKMDEDGWKFAVFKMKKDEEGKDVVDASGESKGLYAFDVNYMVKKVMENNAPQPKE